MIEFLLPMTVFTCVAAFTPGPNNVMVTASGANFGYVRTLPHIGGVVFGYSLLLIALAVGLGEMFRLYPGAHENLRYVGSGYLLFLAYKIARSAPPETGEIPMGKPLTWVQAAIFQCVNAKAWTIAAALIATFTDAENFTSRFVAILIVNVVVSFASVSTWTLFGQMISRYLSDPRHLRAFNYAMGGLLAATCVFMLRS